MVRTGDKVTFVDATGLAHNALVTCVFAGMQGQDNPPGVNVVYVSPDPDAQDQYGRQMVRETSIVHRTNQPAHGMYWEESPRWTAS